MKQLHPVTVIVENDWDSLREIIFCDCVLVKEKGKSDRSENLFEDPWEL